MESVITCRVASGPIEILSKSLSLYADSAEDNVQVVNKAGSSLEDKVLEYNIRGGKRLICCRMARVGCPSLPCIAIMGPHGAPV